MIRTRRTAFALALAFGTGCGTATPPAAPRGAPPSAQTLALGALRDELGALGYRVDPASPAASAVVASRGAHRWYLALRVESTSAPQGAKLLVRVEVLAEPGHALRGEIAPYAIAADARHTASVDGPLARELGKRAADEIDESLARSPE